MQVSLSFGGNSWPINPADMNLGTNGTNGDGDQCVGGIFDLTAASNAGGGGGNPNWIVGDTFLVSSDCFALHPSSYQSAKFNRKMSILCYARTLPP